MKKAISKNKVQRMRNLVSGNYTKKTTIQSGFNTTTTKHKEGDVWEERGKSWTIKNGIKQTITKLDKAREYAKIPLHCPKCNVKMTKQQHKFMYRRFKHCLLCQTNFEFELREQGKYEEWKNKQLSINFEIWLREQKEEFKEFLKTRHSKKQITEAGDIEDWSGGQTDEELIADFDIYINNEMERLQLMTGTSDKEE